MAGAKEPVRLRRRLMASGNTSLYLDIYLDGRRSYEYLKLYLIPERTRADKETNRETLRLAAAIQAKRLVEVRNGEFGFKNKADDDVPFYDYFRELIDEKKTSESKSTVSSWEMTLRHLLAYDGREGLTLRDITKEWVVGFKNHLGKSTLLRCKDGAQTIGEQQGVLFQQAEGVPKKGLRGRANHIRPDEGSAEYAERGDGKVVSDNRGVKDARPHPLRTRRS